MSGLSILLLVSFLNMFFGSVMLFKVGDFSRPVITSGIVVIAVVSREFAQSPALNAMYKKKISIGHENM